MDLNNLDVKTVTTVAAATVGTIVALSAAWVVRDYNQWVAFGTGGTPPTPSGYWRMTKFRWRRFTSGDDLRDASKITGTGTAYLGDIPRRAGKRPTILARTLPQRQHREPIDPAVYERVHALTKKYCEKYPQLLTLDLSKTEGLTTDAIYAKPGLPGRDPSAKDKIMGNEVSHVHPAENSLHIWLSPPDAKQAVKKGWGERFPLSSLGMLHPSFIFVYAPRTMEDVDVIEELVKAGIGYLTGERFADALIH